MARARARKRRRIGIFGGTFSPIHYGHLICAEKTREEFKLDQVDFVVSATPPNKPVGVLDAEERFDMVVAATESNPYFHASRIDLDSGGSGYSLLTVEAMQREYEEADLFYLIGAEYLDPEHAYWLPKWVGSQQLFKLCTFLVFPRDEADVHQAQEWVHLIPDARIEVMDAPTPQLSSTLLRDLVLEGRSLRYATPSAVQQLIAKRGHYRREGALLKQEQLVAESEVKRVGVYAAPFDPIHYGNLLFAEWARQTYSHDRVLFIPTGQPQEVRDDLLDADTRYKFVVSATAENPFFDVSRMDIERNTTSYALLNAEGVRKMFGGHVEIDYIIGSRYLDPSNTEHHLSTWMGYERLCSMARFLVYSHDMTEIEQTRQWAKRINEAKIEVMFAPTLPISSFEIRDLASRGRSIRYMTPYAVRSRIEEDKLYRTKAKSTKRKAE